MGTDLDRDGIAVLPSGGNGFSFILNSCNDDNFAIPNIILFDTDSLDHNCSLLLEAYKTGAIDKGAYDREKEMMR